MCEQFGHVNRTIRDYPVVLNIDGAARVRLCRDKRPVGQESKSDTIQQASSMAVSVVSPLLKRLTFVNWDNKKR